MVVIPSSTPVVLAPTLKQRALDVYRSGLALIQGIPTPNVNVAQVKNIGLGVGAGAISLGVASAVGVQLLVPLVGTGIGAPAAAVIGVGLGIAACVDHFKGRRRVVEGIKRVLGK